MGTEEEKWKVSCFPSGTTIAKKGNVDPHFYIVGCPGYDDSEMSRTKYKVAQEVCRYMNYEEPIGGILEVDHFDMWGKVVLSNGIKLSPTGPSYDSDPPNLNWKQNESEEANEQRRMLTYDLIARMMRGRT